MKVPLSWLKDFVEIDLSLPELAYRLTMAGLEVEEIRLVGLPMPEGAHEFKIEGLSWDPDKIVVAQIEEVMPHPNADRLVLCRLNDGRETLTVLTGAPNLFPYKGQGPLPRPLKVAYAREGARIYDGHQPGFVLTTLKRAKIRGIESFSMVCSEKELGISEEHEGIIILDEDAPVGMPLVDYMGDAVLEIAILPNMIRNASILGVARELAALTGKPLRQPPLPPFERGASIEGRAAIQITDPELNPRFVLGLIEGVTPRPSPYWVQRRLRLAGMRPINSVVDATNYVMLMLGEPLHAFDYDVLTARAGGKPPTIITRTAREGERLTTLDGVERVLEPYMILVTDTAGPLSLAGIMGGLESEVTENTRNVLLEGATWNPVNVRRTASALRLSSEAAYRFARGVHPALAPEAVRVCLAYMAAWSGGRVAEGLVDAYPKPQVDPEVTLSEAEVQRWLGISLRAEEVADLLRRLEFTCRVEGETVVARVPPHRLDIGEGVIGKADLIEEIARLYGYDRLPETLPADPLPWQRNQPLLEAEEALRDVLAGLGLQEVVTYRLTSPEREARWLAPAEGEYLPPDYVRLANPIAPERSVMRRSLLAAVLEVAERNARLTERLAFFEIGPIFLPLAGQDLPEEPLRLALVLSGMRHLPAWDRAEPPLADFFDLKGILEGMAEALHVPQWRIEPASHPGLHPGKCAALYSGERELGYLGELHPLVKARYDFGPAPVLVAELDATALLSLVPERFEVQGVPVYPPVIEDIAVVVDEAVPAAQVEAVIRQAGGKLLTRVRLFDVFRGEQIGVGKKSLAYNLTYQAPDHTLTDAEAAQIRQKIIRRLEQTLGARLRG